MWELPIKFRRRLDRGDAEVILQMIRKGVNTPMTSSCGRLFDAVASLLGLRNRVSYEGQAAVELENCQTREARGTYDCEIEDGGDGLILKTSGIIRGVVQDLERGLKRGVISRRFHLTLIRMFTKACKRLRETSKLERVVMSGGAMQNATLSTGLSRALAAEGFFRLHPQARPGQRRGHLTGPGRLRRAETWGPEGRI